MIRRPSTDKRYTHTDKSASLKMNKLDTTNSD